MEKASESIWLVSEPVMTELDDKVNPKHYRRGKLECIDIIRDMPLCLGSAVQYIWRCDQKGDPEADLRKAIWYLEEELDRRGFSARPRPDR